ncbi:MAG TPA: porin family protein [Flavobacteriaceae bacterium]|nr:porin family protein [Flavobacteriaceae bacterium]
MKNVGLVIVFTLFGAFSAQAQNSTDLIQFGVKAGANFATITGDDFESPESRTAFHAGVLAELPVNERFSIQPEILYSAQGFSADGTFGGVDYTAEYKMDYIQVPILAKIYLVNGLNFQVGPQVGFRINESVEFDTDLGESSEDFNSEENDIDFGVAAGLEYKFDGGFFIQGRYNYGFSEIYEDTDAHNSVIQAGIGFMF